MVAAAKQEVRKLEQMEAIDQARAALFAQRTLRLEQVSVQLRALYREHAACIVAERQAKADLYLHSSATSHGERQGIASAHTASHATEVLQLKGEIDALEEERDFLKFCIEWIGE